MTGFDNLCMNCMSDTNGKTECPNCGFSSAEPQMRHVITLAPANPRAVSAEALTAHWTSLGTSAEAMADADMALEKAFGMLGSDGALLICGSLYLAGEIRPRIIKLLHTK